MINYLKIGLHNNLKTSKPKHVILYRAVSKAELDDIKENGLRNKSDGDGYQTCKLFALTLKDAAKFGKNNFLLDNVCNTLIKVLVPLEIYNNSEKFHADGMQVVSIEINCLNLLKGIPLNRSPNINSYVKH